MSRVAVPLSGLAVLLWILSLGGCGGPSESPPAQPIQPAAGGGGMTHEHGEEAEHAEHAEHEAHGEHEEAFAQLSPEDRALAESQKTCPVSDEPLGAMGTPLKVTVKGRDIFLCCEMCKGQLLEDPDKYLAKLP